MSHQFNLSRRFRMKIMSKQIFFIITTNYYGISDSIPVANRIILTQFIRHQQHAYDCFIFLFVSCQNIIIICVIPHSIQNEKKEKNILLIFAQMSFVLEHIHYVYPYLFISTDAILCGKKIFKWKPTKDKEWNCRNVRCA